MLDWPLLLVWVGMMLVSPWQYAASAWILLSGRWLLLLAAGIAVAQRLTHRLRPPGTAWVLIAAGVVLVLIATVCVGIIPRQFTPPQRRAIRRAMGVGAAGLYLCLLLVHPSHHIGALVLACAAVATWTILEGYLPRRHALTLQCPFRRPFLVFQGGRGVLRNHHWFHRAQRHALDLVVLPEEDDGDAGLARASAGADILAPCDGEVMAVIDGLPDTGADGLSTDTWPGIAGNHVRIRSLQGPCILLAHLQAGSVAVRIGQTVHAGDLVGRCGNSGNSSSLHLHLQVNASEDLTSRSLPLRFAPAALRRRGRLLQDTASDPRRNDVIIPPLLLASAPAATASSATTSSGTGPVVALCP